MTAPLVYFYPHRYMRDRHLDTIRAWPENRVLNPRLAEGRGGEQVDRASALDAGPRRPWQQRLPLVNVKRRPGGLAPEAAVYVWGAVVASGPFIVDLDNPYALTGYNLRAMSLYRGLLRRLLASPRCLEIRCMSRACRRTLGLLFGEAIRQKAGVHYPRLARALDTVPPAAGQAGCRFLFVATQFEIKGGAALLRAFPRVVERVPRARLDIVTHLPPDRAALAAGCPGLTVHAATLERAEIGARFMARADVLVHPTYVDSFGMVALEALAHGLALIATDVYALREMVRDGVNGRLLEAPLSIWDGDRPAPLFARSHRAATEATRLDTALFEEHLVEAMVGLAGDPAALRAARAASLALFDERFRAR